MAEAAGVEPFSVLTTRKLLIVGTATTAKKAQLPNPLYVYCTKMPFPLESGARRMPKRIEEDSTYSQTPPSPSSTKLSQGPASVLLVHPQELPQPATKKANADWRTTLWPQSRNRRGLDINWLTRRLKSLPAAANDVFLLSGDCGFRNLSGLVSVDD